MADERKRTHAWIGDVWLDVAVRESHSAAADVSEHPVEVGSAIADHVRPTPRTIEIEGMVTNHPIEMPESHTGPSSRPHTSTRSIEVASPRRMAPHSMEIEAEPSVGALGMLPGVDQGVALLGALRLDVTSKRRYAMDIYTTDPAIASHAFNALYFTQPFNRVTAVHAALLRIIDESLLVTVVTALTTYQNVALTSLAIDRSGKIGRDRLSFTATGRVLRLVKSEVVEIAAPPKVAKSRGKQAAPVVAETPTPEEPAPVNNDSYAYGTKLFNLTWGGLRPAGP